jgi:hypothetical protein
MYVDDELSAEERAALKNLHRLTSMFSKNLNYFNNQVATRRNCLSK